MKVNLNPAKKTYDPPQVTVIKLRPEEAVLANCKNTNSRGPFSSCHRLGGNCRSIGS